ncbi:hypothetical protein [Spiroplasma chinense]|nr:hypothetical protein [Spiroplasma chinense]
MKKWLKMLFLTNINVIPLVNLYGGNFDLSESENNTRNFLEDNEFDMYFKIDLSQTKNVEKFVQENYKQIIEENLSDYDLHVNEIKKLNFKLLEVENFTMTVEITDVPGSFNLGKKIIKSFDLYLYNYDNVDLIQEALANEVKLELSHTKDVHNNIHESIKEKFNRICSNFIYLNGEEEFFDYLDFHEHPNDNELKADFLGSSNISFKIETK